MIVDVINLGLTELTPHPRVERGGHGSLAGSPLRPPWSRGQGAGLAVGRQGVAVLHVPRPRPRQVVVPGLGAGGHVAGVAGPRPRPALHLQHHTRREGGCWWLGARNANDVGQCCIILGAEVDRVSLKNLKEQREKVQVGTSSHLLQVLNNIVNC